jgi:hypothetical protein
MWGCRALIDSSVELQERDLMKMASMTVAIADALANLGVLKRHATFVAQMATAAVTTGIDDWAREPERGLAGSIEGALAALRSALGSPDRDNSPVQSL